MGYKDTGLPLMVWTKAGGYYMGKKERRTAVSMTKILTNPSQTLSNQKMLVQVNTSLTER